MGHGMPREHVRGAVKDQNLIQILIGVDMCMSSSLGTHTTSITVVRWKHAC